MCVTSLHNMSDLERYLSPNEVAKILLVKPITVRKWSQSGALEAVFTPGGHRRYTMAAVHAFAHKHGIQLCVSTQKILIVDDDRFICDFLQEFLRDKNSDILIDVANNGFEAGQKVVSFHPSKILLDLNMPGMSGVDVCRVIKNNPEVKDIDVIAMSGDVDSESFKNLRKSGFTDFLRKPIKQEKLIGNYSA